MKKILTIALALCLIFAMVACGGGGGSSNAPASNAPASNAPASNAPASNAPSGGGSSEPASNDSGLPVPAKIGYFDRDFDYTQYPTYKVGFISMMNDNLTLEQDTCYAEWAKKFNINYTPLYAVTSSSMDDFLSTLQTYCDQGFDALLLAPDSTAYNRVVEVCAENDIWWFSHLSAARDYTGNERLMAPMSGYDQRVMGQDAAYKLLEWKEEAFPDVAWDDVAYICCTWSIAPEVHLRSYEQERIWSENNPAFGDWSEQMTENPKNFFIADAASGNSDQATIQNLVTQIVSSNAPFKVYLISGCIDFWAIGAANAIENLGLNDISCVVSAGGSNMREYCDAGIVNAWRYAYYGPSATFTEFPMAALWAYCAGLATPETIWPEWVDPNDKGDVKDENGNVTEEHNFAKMDISSYWMSHDNYQELVEWADLYLFGDGDGLYDYPKVTDISLYNPYGTPRN